MHCQDSSLGDLGTPEVADNMSHGDADQASGTSSMDLPSHLSMTKSIMHLQIYANIPLLQENWQILLTFPLKP